MFCSCRANYQKIDPNMLVCPVCLGLPGTLPVINEKAVKYTVATGLALNCKIAENTKFDRKNYPYPDLMKGYQISQFDAPIASDGYLEIQGEEGSRFVRIERVHLEEDVAKLQHVQDEIKGKYSLVDVNRSGVPLMEIVGHPDLRSPLEARNYLTELRAILQYIGVTTGNMQEGSFRCDANVSIRPKGSDKYMTRTEVKNMNSFRAVYNALEYEVSRQTSIVDNGGKVAQETRGWIEDRGVTVSQRSKEYAHDYRFFPEPDLPPLNIDHQWVEHIKLGLPELPGERRKRFIDDYELPLYDIKQLTAYKQVADFFEDAVSLCTYEGVNLKSVSKSIGNWILGDVTRLINMKDVKINETKLRPSHLAELVRLIDNGVLSSTLAKPVLEESFKTGGSPAEIVENKGYNQINDLSVLRVAVLHSMEENPKAVSDYLKGKETAAQFVLGQVMKATKGKANPNLVMKLIKEVIGDLGLNSG